MPVNFAVKAAVTAGLMVAQVALGMTRKIKGPRLDELTVSTADYGTPIPRFWGIRRFQTPIIWADKLREVKKTSKTKGGKYTEYKYYGSWAVLIADVEIDAIRRIWFDKHLVYQVGDVGPISVGSFVGNLLTQASGRVMKLAQGNNMRFYLGTESQTADPLIEAWCDDRYGANSCPAYKGVAYIVFEDIPLEKLGNHIPQVTVEVVRTKTDAFPIETAATAKGLNNAQFSPDGSRLVVVNGSSFETWDVANRTLLATVPTTAGGGVGMLAGGSFYAVSGFFGGDIILVGPNGGETVAADDPSGIVSECYVAGNHVLALSGGDGFYVGGNTLTSIGVSFTPTTFFTDLNGEAWALGLDASSDIALANLDQGIEFTVAASGSGTAWGMVNPDNNIVVQQTDGTFHLIDPNTQTVTATGSGAQPLEINYRNVRPGAPSIWLRNGTTQFSEYSTTTLSLVRTISTLSYSGGFATGTGVYDPVNHAWIAVPQFVGTPMAWYYIDRVGSSGVTLKTIVDEVSTWEGLSASDLDTTALTQTIDGYSVTQGSGKDMIGPLLDIHDVDARPHDWQVQFVNRGGSPSGTILTEEFVRGESRYTVTVQQDTDLPKKVTFTYADSDHDQQANTAIAQRPLDAVDSLREEQIDLSTYVATPDTAQRLADRYFRRLWNSRERPKNTVTAQQLALEPGDVKTIQLRQDDNAIVTRNVRLDKMTIRGSAIDCEWVRDETSFAVLNNATGAPMDGRDDEVIFVPSQTRGFVLDSPLVQDSDNDINPLLYYAAGKYTSGWAGAFLLRGDDGTYDEVFGSVDSTQGCVHGIVTGTLGDANPNLWDRGNSVSITVYGGTLTTVTEAEIDADPELNMAAIGDNGRWEYINFTTATLTGSTSISNTYTVSGFKRGRRGTEANTGNHATGDGFLLLSAALNTQLGTDDVGDNISFKVVSTGRDPDGSPAVDFTPYTGATLKPYAPARLKWTTDGTDLFGEIFRRTRVGGSWNGGSAIPLSENSEEYEVDVLDGSGNVLRTITVSGTNTFTYTAAQIAADGASVSAPPDVNVYQLSDTTGRGFALAA